MPPNRAALQQPWIEVPISESLPTLPNGFVDAGDHVLHATYYQVMTGSRNGDVGVFGYLLQEAAFLFSEERNNALIAHRLTR